MQMALFGQWIGGVPLPMGRSRWCLRAAYLVCPIMRSKSPRLISEAIRPSILGGPLLPVGGRARDRLLYRTPSELGLSRYRRQAGRGRLESAHCVGTHHGLQRWQGIGQGFNPGQFPDDPQGLGFLTRRLAVRSRQVAIPSLDFETCLFAIRNPADGSVTSKGWDCSGCDGVGEESS